MMVNGTRMRRMRRIIADKPKENGVNPLYPRHPHSINSRRIYGAED